MPPRLRTTPNPMAEILVQKDLGVCHFFFAQFQFPHTQDLRERSVSLHQSTYRIIITCLRCAAPSPRMPLPLGADIGYDDMMVIDRR